MKIEVTTTPENPPVPTNSSLIMVREAYGLAENPAAYCPQTDTVAYIKNGGYDYYSIVKSRCRGLRQGETITIAA
jgi:hypothetical protein